MAATASDNQKWWNEFQPTRLPTKPSSVTFVISWHELHWRQPAAPNELHTKRSFNQRSSRKLWPTWIVQENWDYVTVVSELFFCWVFVLSFIQYKIILEVENQIYFYLIQAFSFHRTSFDVKSCLLRTVCETQQFLLPRGYSLLQDMLRVVFT